MTAFETDEGVGEFLWLPKSMKNGSLANNSEFKMGAHTGTHVDAPGHVFDHYFDAGFDVDTLDLGVLNGLFVDVPRNTNITAEVMQSLHIPKGVRRVIFRTLNTDRQSRLVFVVFSFCVLFLELADITVEVTCLVRNVNIIMLKMFYYAICPHHLDFKFSAVALWNYSSPRRLFGSIIILVHLVGIYHTIQFTRKLF